jgi:hypothetical protein
MLIERGSFAMYKRSASTKRRVGYAPIALSFLFTYQDFNLSSLLVCDIECATTYSQFQADSSGTERHHYDLTFGRFS